MLKEQYPALKNDRIVEDHVYFITSNSKKAGGCTDSPISYHYRVLNKYMGNRVAKITEHLMHHPDRRADRMYVIDSELVPIDAKNWYVYSTKYTKEVLKSVFQTDSVATGDLNNEFCYYRVGDDGEGVRYNVHTMAQQKRLTRMLKPRWWWGENERVVGIYVDFTYANNSYGHRNNYHYLTTHEGQINVDSTCKIVYEVEMKYGGVKVTRVVTDRLVGVRYLADVIINEWFIFPVGYTMDKSVKVGEECGMEEANEEE